LKALTAEHAAALSGVERAVGRQWMEAARTGNVAALATLLEACPALLG
jgi:hypothetical protein